MLLQCYGCYAATLSHVYFAAPQRAAALLNVVEQMATTITVTQRGVLLAMP